MTTLTDLTRLWLSDISHFSRLVVKRPLFAYQLAPARAIVDSVLHSKGLEFAVLFPRQSGKNETQAQLESYLLNVFQRVPGATIVKAQPSMKPQGLNALARLQLTMTNALNTGRFKTTGGYQVRLGEAMVIFYSANPDANTVGATASLLLECDEAQDVLEAEWDKKFVPMAAFRNATIVFWGTAWTARTLLAKVIRRLRDQEAQDAIPRVFIVTPEQVAAENPAYGDFVKRQVAARGRNHPLVRTQFFNEEIDAEGGMFPPARRALMQGLHPASLKPEPDKLYAILLDVAGEDEGAIGERTDLAALENPRRDATVATIVEVDLATLVDPILRAPTYRVQQRHIWVGVKHASLYAKIRALAAHWKAKFLVADATGVGAGLVSFLANALTATTVLPFDFNSHTKSLLGWDFLAICESGRFLDYTPALGDEAAATFWRELEFCQYEVMPGPSRLLRWGVPDGTRDPATGELVHDDTVLGAALCAVLDVQAWHADTGPTHIIRGVDPLIAMDKGF